MQGDHQDHGDHDEDHLKRSVSIRAPQSASCSLFDQRGEGQDLVMAASQQRMSPGSVVILIAAGSTESTRQRRRTRPRSLLGSPGAPGSSRLPAAGR
jgi:hypothetical protein